MSKFPKTIKILSKIQGLEGAIVFNFVTGEIFININHGLDLSGVIEPLCAAVMRQQNLIRELVLLDMIEYSLTITNHHYHMTYIAPQFDNVAVYLIVSRYTMLPYITKAVEDAVYSMY